jgi:anaerobic selenocysteine-containing dehydrogenase
MRSRAEGDVRTHFATCPLCEAMCGLEVQTRDREILSIRGDAEDPFSRGHVCAKAVALADVHADPDRLRQPLRRTAAGWEVMSWEAALDLAAERLAAVQARHGRDAVAVYLGNPTVHSYGAALGSLAFVRALQTRHRYSATSVDQLPHHVVATLMYGHQLLLPIPDLDRTRYFLVLGANPVASNGSLMTAPGVRQRLTALRARGGRLVVVDPRRSETAVLADRHLAIRPGTDALFLLAVLETLHRENLVTPGRLRDLAAGWDEVARLVEPFPAERVAAPTGLDAGEIRLVARELAAAGAAGGAVCYGRFGVSTQEFGSLSQWLIQLVNIVTGNLDREGGAMFTRPAFDLVALTARLGQFGQLGKRRTRLRGLPSFGSELPVATLAEEILGEAGETAGEVVAASGDGAAGAVVATPIRALVTLAGNPVLSAPNGARLERALPGLEFRLAIDIYLNETTRHADLVLPPTFGLERDHYDVVFHALAVRNTAKYAAAVFAPGPEQRHDHEILGELGRRLERVRRRQVAAGDPGAGAKGVPGNSRRGRAGLLSRLLAAWVTPRRVLAWGLRFGPYGQGWLPFSRGLTLARLERTPHGVDLGPLRPSLPGRLYTRSRRIELAPAVLVADLARLAARFPLPSEPTSAEGELPPGAAAEAESALLLIGRRHARSNNSWLHNSHRLVKGPERCTLLIHPDDAAARGIGNGERVRVVSRAGAVELAAEVTEGIRRGVVSLPHGWGHHRPGVQLRVAAARPGVSANDLTDELRVDALSGNAAFSAVPVTVERVGADGRQSARTQLDGSPA